MMLLCQKFGTWGPGPLTCVEVAFFPFNHNDGDFLYTAASPSLKSSMLRFCSFSKSRSQELMSRKAIWRSHRIVDFSETRQLLKLESWKMWCLLSCHVELNSKCYTSRFFFLLLLCHSSSSICVCFEIRPPSWHEFFHYNYSLSSLCQ